MELTWFLKEPREEHLIYKIENEMQLLRLWVVTRSIYKSSVVHKIRRSFPIVIFQQILKNKLAVNFIIRG